MAAGGATTATPTSAWDVAAAAASCEDGHGEEDVHNGDPGEHAGHASERASGRLRRGRPRTSAAAAVNLKPTAGDGAGANLLAAGAGAWPQAPVGAARHRRRRALAPAGAGGDEGRRAAPRDEDRGRGRRRQRRGGDGRFLPGLICMPATRRQIAINTLKPNHEFNRTD